MKRKNFKSYCLGFLSAVLICGLCCTAFATSSEQQITALFQNIKIVLDGETLNPTDATGATVEPFIYNGTTYLPVRALGEAIGKEVSWDSATSTVYLSDPVATTPSTTSYSRTNPAPFNTVQSIDVSTYSANYSADVEITSAYRGIVAWKLIEATNRYNDEAPDGMEYIIFKAKATVTAGGDDSAIDFSEYNFTPFSAENAEYSRVSVVDDPAFDGKAYTGGTIEGWISILVNEDDPAPKVVFGNNYDGSGGIWFDLSEA